MNKISDDPRPLVGIVLLNYNGDVQTIECLKTLKKLKYSEYEIVVIDNSSSLGSISAIADEFPEVAIIKNSANLGYAGGNNVGIRHFIDKGCDLVWILNNDTRVEPESLSWMVRCVINDSRIGAVGALILEGNDSERNVVNGGGYVNLVTGMNTCAKLADSRLPDFLTGACTLFRIQSLRDVGLLNEDYFLYWEDVDTSIELKKKGWNIAVAPKAIVYHDASSTLGKLSAKGFYYNSRASVKFFMKHSNAPYFALLCLISLRAGKRILRGDWYSLFMCMKGWYDGFRMLDSKYKEI